MNFELLKKGTAKEWDQYLPNFVKNTRDRLGLSQQELAEAMQRTGIYRGKGVVNFIYRIERGLTTFRFVDFISLMMAVRQLGYPVTFSEIFGEKTSAETANTNLLQQRVELMEAELKQKDDIINRYKELLSQS
jgi:transcriptional regulator with XRE-family HTH domain